ncbi:MAG: hypothetical protein H0W08_18695 [Acidobacteria bacterium]|nr:hypothetical protein [Acidobacteriota bacterium]
MLDTQGANSTTRSADVPPLPAALTPTPAGFTVSGLVKEEGGSMPSATVVIKDTPQTTSGANGRYAFTGA